MADWRHAVLKRIGAPVTQANLQFLGSWQRQEGGHTNNDATWNWLNTTRSTPGAVRSINSVGVKAYRDRKAGINATVKTLTSDYYKNIVTGLRSGNPNTDAVRHDLGVWVAGPGGADSEHAQAYASRVLGGSGKHATMPGSVGAAGLTPLQKQQKALPPVDGPNIQKEIALSHLRLGDAWRAGAPTPSILEMAQERQALQAAADAAEQRANQYGGTTIPAPSKATGKMPAAKNGKVAKALEIANGLVGTPYVFGAESPKEGGFDCSGLIDYAFKQAGIPIPGRLTTYTALKLGKPVDVKNPQPGDWLIKKDGGHMVMYVGNGRVIAAPRTGEVVQYQPSSSFQGDNYTARRYA